MKVLIAFKIWYCKKTSFPKAPKGFPEIFKVYSTYASLDLLRPQEDTDWCKKMSSHKEETL